VGSDSSITHSGYVRARTGLVEAQNKIIRNKTIKKIFFFLILKLKKYIQKTIKTIKIQKYFWSEINIFKVYQFAQLIRW